MEAAFFDLDKTVVSRSSTLALSRPLYRAGMVSRSQLLRGAYAQLVYLLVGADEGKMERLKEGMLQLTRGWDRAQVERLVENVILDVIDPHVYAEALDLMELHRAEGRRIYIVSSSPEEVVRPLARHFGVSGVIATRAEVGPDGRYTGALAFYAYGEQTAEAVKAIAERTGLDLAGSFAYTDSITDLPMLEAVGHPVAVNPDRELRRLLAACGLDHQLQRFDQERLSAIRRSVGGHQWDRVADTLDESAHGQARRRQGQHRTPYHGWIADTSRDQVGRPDRQPQRVAHNGPHDSPRDRLIPLDTPQTYWSNCVPPSGFWIRTATT